MISDVLEIEHLKIDIMFRYSSSSIAHIFPVLRFGIVFFLLLLFVPSSAQKTEHPFKPGERLNYTMHFGWFEVGKAEFWIDPELQYIDGEAYYSVQGVISPSSWGKIFKAITGCYESLINVKTLRPIRSHREMKSGKKVTDVRTDNFNYSDTLKIHTYVEDVDQHRYRAFPQEENVPMRDFLSTFLFVRTVQFNNDEPLDMRSFYSNTLYEFRVIPGEKKDYDLKKSKIKSREYRLEFPKNEYFKRGKNGGAIVSEEADRRPLRIQIDMTLGSFYLKLDEES